MESLRTGRASTPGSSMVGVRVNSGEGGGNWADFGCHRLFAEMGDAGHLPSCGGCRGFAVSSIRAALKRLPTRRRRAAAW